MSIDPTHPSGASFVRPLTPAQALSGSRGAFDLPSILVGVVTVGVLTAGVLASVFGVIPFAQDNGAKQDLDAVRTAQGVAKAKDSGFMASAGLVSAGYLPDVAKIAAGTDDAGSCYTAVALSGSGRMFYAESTAPSPMELTNAATPACVSDAKLRTLIDQAGGNSSSRPAATPEAPVLTGEMQGALARASWAAPERAETYRIERNRNNAGWVEVPGPHYDTTHATFLSEGDTIEYRVYALNGSGSSPVSNTVSLHRAGYTNVFTNSGFEDREQGWSFLGNYTIGTAGWLNGYGNVVTNRSVDLSITGASAVTAGESMEAAVTIENQGSDAALRLRFYDATGSEVSGGRDVAIPAHMNMTRFGTGYVTAPSGAVTAKVTVESAASGDTIDNVTLFVWR